MLAMQQVSYVHVQQEAYAGVGNIRVEAVSLREQRAECGEAPHETQRNLGPEGETAPVSGRGSPRAPLSGVSAFAEKTKTRPLTPVRRN